MDSFFKKLGKQNYLLVLFILFILFNFLLNRFMPQGLALDIRFAYSASEAYHLLEMMGEETREKYLMVIWALDTPYMMIYFLLLVGLFSKTWKRRKFLFLPVAIVALDFLENVLVSTLIVTFPTENYILGYFASFFTTAKWVCVLGCVLFLIVGLVRNYVLRNQPDLDVKG